jgi:hypothetical protein
VRCIGLGPQTLLMNYDPSAPLHERYRTDQGFVTPVERKLIEDITLTINAFFGWDFNSCEALLQKGTWYPIDFANPCPDSQVTSLHEHFPSLVKAKIRWALFVAATKRKMRANLDWAPYFAVKARNLPLPEAILEYGKLARAHFEAERFEEFCATNLSRLDEAAWEYFGSPRARAAVRKKVEMIFPRHEWDKFTDHFMAAFQSWREQDQKARAATAKPAAKPAAAASTPIPTPQGATAAGPGAARPAAPAVPPKTMTASAGAGAAPAAASPASSPSDKGAAKPKTPPKKR